MGLLESAAIIIGGFILGSALASYIPLLKLPFLSKNEMNEEVNRRAGECFYNYGIGNTAGGTGILLYISLYEHMVVVKGDVAINKKLNQEHWDTICSCIIDGLEEPDRGLVNAVGKCGELLSEHFPSSDENPNELPNEIYFIG